MAKERQPRPAGDRLGEQHRGDEAKEIRYPDGRIEHPGVSLRAEGHPFGLRSGSMACACCHVWRSWATWLAILLVQEAAQAGGRRSRPIQWRRVSSAKLPPEPRLEQLDRMAAVRKLRRYQRLAAKEKALNSYGPTAEKGFVHIPIQQAIKAVAGKLPVAKEPSQARPPQQRPAGRRASPIPAACSEDRRHEND